MDQILQTTLEASILQTLVRLDRVANGVPESSSGFRGAMGSMPRPSVLLVLHNANTLGRAQEDHVVLDFDLSWYCIEQK